MIAVDNILRVKINHLSFLAPLKSFLGRRSSKYQPEIIWDWTYELDQRRDFLWMWTRPNGGVGQVHFQLSSFRALSWKRTWNEKCRGAQGSAMLLKTCTSVLTSRPQCILMTGSVCYFQCFLVIVGIIPDLGDEIKRCFYAPSNAFLNATLLHPEYARDQENGSASLANNSYFPITSIHVFRLFPLLWIVNLMFAFKTSARLRFH